MISRAALLAVCFATQAFAASWKWEPVGIGGGGQFLNPTISPHDPKLLFASSDMGGVYRSADGGASWATLPQGMLKRLEYAPYSPVMAFHPVDPKIILTSSADGLCRSDDAGLTWKVIGGLWKSGPRLVTFLSGNEAIAFFDGHPAAGHVTIFRSVDAGLTWNVLAELPEGAGELVNALRVKSGIVVGATGGIFLVDVSGRGWRKSVKGLPEGESKCTDLEGADSGGIDILYASVGGRLCTSADGGESWRLLGTKGEVSHIALGASDAGKIYASIKGKGADDSSGLFRSDDAGVSWVSVWNHDAKEPGYDVTNGSWLSGQWGSTHAPSGVTVDPKNSSHVFATTITSALLSEDAGKTWRQVHAPAGTADSQPAGGMMVTTVWNYYVHPGKPENHFAALTDFAGWTSRDAARTWRYSVQGSPWHNMYAIAADPEDPAKLWAACAGTHDLPTWKYQSGLGTYPGGIAVSADGGASWKPVDAKSGLPRKAVTDIWLDPASAAGPRHLWAALPGQGIYFSADGGATWAARNSGFNKWNTNLLRVRGNGRGKLYAMSTVRAPGNQERSPGELYVSEDKGVNWRKIFSEKASPFLTNFHAGADGALFVCALSTTYNDDKGGALWRSTDGGANWKVVLDHPVYGVAVDPKFPERVYASSWRNRGDGLYQSEDGGGTWARAEGYPYWEPMNISFDPVKEGVIYVTNFGGGVFRGIRSK